MPNHPSCQHIAYRLTCADYDALWEFAQGRCQICGLAPEDTPRGVLVIDHDSRYGIYAVRGLLCSKCNTLMQFVDSNTKNDHRASAYLRNAWFARLLVARHEDNVAAAAHARRLQLAQLPTPATRKEN